MGTEMNERDTAGTPERFELGSLSPLDHRYAVLRETFPEAFDEDQLDYERLQLLLGVREPADGERYGLTWPGKEQAVRALQEPSVGTLVPDSAKSMNPDESRDVVIEGDNLEVLKLLQKAYYGKVKMIYIDPPYNTGKEFIYPDNFREGLESYLRFSGQVDDDGVKLRANAETNGRYHSNWLSMMYPRLALARNLLKSDGVIFATIDDHEVHNLRFLMDEIFGPENFIATCIWQKVYSPKNTARHFSDDHDYIHCYARNSSLWLPNLLPRTEEMEARYKNPDDDERGSWKPADLSARNYYSKGTYEVACPGGRQLDGPPDGRYWTVSPEAMDELDADNRIWWGEDGNAVPQQKIFLSEVKAGKVPQTLWKYEDVGHTQEAKKELLERVTFASSDSVFDTPKPTRLIERMLRLATNSNSEDLVLDFFAGSGATGEAVWKLNQEDGGNRRFILVQLPEPTGYDDYETVADITRARLIGAHDALEAEADGTLGGDPVAGFLSYRLEASNFEVWPARSGASDVEGALTLFADNVREGATESAIVTELLLKAGFELTADVRQVELADEVVYSVEDAQLLVYVGKALTLGVVEAMVALEPSLILVLDTCFGDDDELKVNAMQTVRSRNHGAGSDIALKVV